MRCRAIKEGFRGVGRHWAMALSSSIAVTITLVIISLFMVFMANVTQFTQNIEQGMKISVMIDYDHESSEQENAIRSAIEKIEGVRSVTFSGKEQELEYYIAQFDDEKTKEAFSPFVEENPMHDAFYVEVTDGEYLATVAETISGIEGVSGTNYGGQSTVSMVKAMDKVRRGGTILVAALSILAIFLIQNTIKLTIYARKDEISIERNVGATNRFIRSPFVVEGILIGAIGAIIPIAFTVWGYQYLYRISGGYIISSMFRLVKPYPFSMYLSLALLVIGMLVGLIGSWLSATKYLKWKR